jgi:hypothetical protein
MARQEIDIVPSEFVGRPILTNGDADFWGPPNFLARVWLENRSNVVVLNGRYRWEEPKPDFTTFQLDTQQIVFDIRSRLGDGWYFVQFRDQYDLDLAAQQIPGINRGLQTVYESNQGIVSNIRAQGDSYGGWFGGADDPVVDVLFNRVFFTVSND